MNDRDRLTYLPRHYYDLQAQRFAPLWIASLASLIYNARPGHWIAQGPAGRTLPFLGLLAVEALWYWMTMRYYRWRLGRLDVKHNILTIGFNWWLIYYALGNCAHAPWSDTPWAWRDTPWLAGPIIVIMLLLPLIDFRNPCSRRVQYAVGSAVVFAVTIASSLYGWDARAFIATTCLTALALSLADHMLLMSLRTPVCEEADD
jgi:hypothetical protein